MMHQSKAITAEEWLKLKASIQELLDLCAANEVEVPGHIRLDLLGEDAIEEGGTKPKSVSDLLCPESAEKEQFQEFYDLVELLGSKLPDFDFRIKDGSYKATNYYEEDPAAAAAKHDTSRDGPRRARQKISTVQTESPIYRLARLVRRFVRNRGNLRMFQEEKVIMDKVNLTLKSGKMYLVLGAPGSGKSTLLKMFAHTLFRSKDHVVGGSVSIDGLNPEDDVYWSNLVCYMDQIDRLHPYLTVYETCAFAWKCRSGGTHRRPWFSDGPEVDAQIEKMDAEMTAVNKILAILGLTRVKDTFVGDQQTVRGVSGGEKKRVTVAEMLCGTDAPLICADEISTGLDAATTYDITKTFRSAVRIKNATMLVSLLQPPPETVANFDELILLSDGLVFYSGPVGEVIDYFNSLGYSIPDRVDVADWLQALPTPEGWKFLIETSSGELTSEELRAKHLSPAEFSERFYSSELGALILTGLKEKPKGDNNSFVQGMASRRYANTRLTSLKLLARRELLLWFRDKYQIRAKFMQSTVMGVIVGTLFWQQTSPQSIIGVTFNSLMYAVVGAMGLVVKQFPDRSIFYKHQDANFFPTWAYVVGKTVSGIPVAMMDGILFATLIYWFVGLAFGDGASIGHYFMFMLMLFTASFTTNLFFSMYVAAVSTITVAQACMALTAVVLVLFSGFTVQPNVIPPYYIWVYWLNFFGWLYRGIAANQFDSGAFDQVDPGSGLTQGELILTQFGFIVRDEPVTFMWSVWSVLFSIAVSIVAICCSTLLLERVRFATGRSLVLDSGDDQGGETPSSERIKIPFKRATLTFKGVQYSVKGSTSSEMLELLKGVSGVIEAGRMTALMGSSGAGKTTLMDVLAMRKNSGIIEGEIRINGHLQEEDSFRRCTGFVEQFDTQSPQLTVKETLVFSARLRLDQADPAVTEDSLVAFVDETMAMLELSNIQNLQVGSDETGGLSFEQRKRLSIAEQLVASPSIIFLDEPTSGLDARAASIVMRGLKRIAASGRAVCATIHQPSIAIFSDFDCLLLLKRGGETIFFGDLGDNSVNLIKYLEGYSATPAIQPGENPATWMLTTIGAGSAQSNAAPFDYAGMYVVSHLHGECLRKIDAIAAEASDENKVSFASKFATSERKQGIEVLKRALLIYYRSPSYNVVRVLVSVAVALLFSSVYASQRVPQNESDMNSRINSIFVAVVFLCVSAINTILNVFQTERNMFYKHKTANMYGSHAILLGYSVSELPFLLIASTFFMIFFYFIMGFEVGSGKFCFFWLYLFLGMATFAFSGQMFMSLLRDSQTAQGVSGLFISCSLLFAGILLRPDQIPSFYIFAYWLFPGHYLFEGLFTTQFYNDDTLIEATLGSPFYLALGCTGSAPCRGTVAEWMTVNFADYNRDNVPYGIGYFIGFLFLTRVVTYWALTNLNYRST